MGEKKSNVALLFQIALLKKRNRQLKNKLASLEDKLERNSRISRAFEKVSPDVSIEKYSSYLNYKYHLIKSTGIWSTAERIVTYSKRSLFVARLIKYTALIVAFIETSAVLLLCATVLTIAIPLTLATTLIFYLSDIIAARKYNKLVITKLENKKIVFLVTRRSYKKSKQSYFKQLANDLANEGYFVAVVSPSLIDGLFHSVKFENDNLVIIRETYFFRLKKAIKNVDIDNNKTIIVY